MIIIPHYREKHCFPAKVNTRLVSLDQNSLFTLPCTTCCNKAYGWNQKQAWGVASLGRASNFYITRRVMLTFPTPLSPFGSVCLWECKEHIVPICLYFGVGMIHLCLCAFSNKLIWRKICHWLQIKHTVSWVQRTIERFKTIIWTLISLEKTRRYTVQDMANNELFVQHKGSP